jgi:WD40 repeat protein
MSLLIHLFVRWEEALLQGRELSPEELAAERPELLEGLREGIAFLKRMRQLALATLSEKAPPQPPDVEQQPTTPPIPVGASGENAAPPGYEVLGEMGRGGMSVVYRARQLALGREVALKMILSGRHAGADARARFLFEAEAIARVKHPGIVQVFDYGTHDGLAWYSLELCEGGSLARRLREGPLPPGETALVVEQVARAVQAAHDANIIHRDLKPGNVLLGAGGAPKVADFGLARLGEGEGHTETGAVVGTASYMSPEQARGSKDVGPPTDVWALGALLYAGLTGRPPFQAATTMETLAQVIGDDAVPVRLLNAAVPADLETICHKCLQKEPGRRYGSAAEMADDLGRWLRGEPITARPVGRLERLWSWCRREPITASLVGMVAVLLLAGTAVAWGLVRWALGEKGRADMEVVLKDKEALAAREAERTAKDNEALAIRQKEAAYFQTLRAEDARHAGQMALALRAWLRHDVAGAERLLDEVPPRYQRAWETRHLRSLCRRKALPLLGHIGPVAGVAFSPDGTRIASAGGDTRIASAGGDNTVRIWDAHTGRETLTLKGRISSVLSVQFSPDGEQIASGSKDGTVRVWDARKGKPLLTLKGHTGWAFCVAYSPDGERIASASEDRTVRIWDARTGKEGATLKGHTASVSSVAFSPDGERIATGCADKKVRVYDARTGREKLSLKGHASGVHCVAFSPDGGRIVSAGSGILLGGAIKVWDACNGHQVFSLEGQFEIFSVAYSPDGTRIVSGGSDDCLPGGAGEVKVWDAQKGEELFSLKGHTTIVNGVAFSPEGEHIASGSADGTVRVWCPHTGPELLSLKDASGPVAFSPDGTRIASRYLDTAVRVWDANTGLGLLSLRHQGAVSSVAFSPGGNRIVSGGGHPFAPTKPGEVKVWDARTGQQVFSFEGHEAIVWSVSFSPDGRRIASGGGDRAVKVWDAHNGQRAFSLKGHTGAVSSAAFSPNGRHIVSGSWDGAVKVWDARTGKELASLKGHTSAVYSVAYSPHGRRIVSAGGDLFDPTRPGEVKVWDAQKGQELLSLNGHTSAVTSVAFSPDGERIASNSDDGMRLWSPRTGQEMFTIKGASGHIAFSPDGNRIASPGEMTVRVWDAEEEQKVLTRRGHIGRARGVTFSPDGKRVVSVDSQGKRLDFDAATGKPLPPDNTPLPKNQRRAEQPGGRLIAITSGSTVILYGPPTDATEAKCFLRRQATLAWHAEQADNAEKQKRWPAAAFHLERLHRSAPGRRTRERLLAALKQAESVSPSQAFNGRPQFAIVPTDAPDRANPLTQTIKRNLQATDAARAASFFGLCAGPPLAAPLWLPPPAK